MSLKSNSYAVQTVTTLQELEDVRLEWEDFLKDSSTAHGFWQNPQIIKANIDYRETGKPLIIILRRNKKIECIAPGVIERSRFQLNFSVFRIPGPKISILKIVDSSLIFSQHAIINNCITKIMDSLNNRKELFDVIKLETLENSNPLYSFFKNTNNHQHFQLKSTSPKKEHVWRHFLSETYDDWLNTLGKSTRRLIRRRVKTLHKNYPDQIELKQITTSDEIPQFLDWLDELYPKTWQAKTFGLSKRNSKRDIIFYKNIAKRGWLRSYILLIDKKPVAFLTATQYADTFEAQEIGYDAEFSSIGVGSTLNYMILQDLYSYNKPAVLSFGFGDNTYKEILCNNKTPASEAYLTQANLTGILIKSQILLSSLEQKIRLFLIKYHLDQKLRKLLKRK